MSVIDRHDGQPDAVSAAKKDKIKKHIKSVKTKAVNNHTAGLTKTLSEDMKKKIREAFFSVKNLAFGEMGTVARFDPASDKDYDPLREIASALKLDLRKFK